MICDELHYHHHLIFPLNLSKRLGIMAEVIGSGGKTQLSYLSANLVVGGITPGYRTPGTLEKQEAAIKGSNYITYRYFNEKTKKSIWPQSDPCQQIQVSLKEPQPDVPKLDKQKIVTLEKIQHTM